MGTPMIYCVETTAGALRLFNAVISTGSETAAQRVAVAPSMELEATAVAELQRSLRWLAEGPKVKWEKVVKSARTAVRKFLKCRAIQALLAPQIDDGGDDPNDRADATADFSSSVGFDL